MFFLRLLNNASRPWLLFFVARFIVEEDKNEIYYFFLIIMFCFLEQSSLLVFSFMISFVINGCCSFFRLPRYEVLQLMAGRCVVFFLTKD